MTKAELRNAVLVKLRVKRSEEEPNAEDARIVEEAIDGILGGYLEDGFYIDNADIPVQIQRSLIYVMANDLLDDFHVPENRAIRLSLTASRHNMLIRHHLGLPLNGQPVRAVYF